jgi:sugar phosphate isomerase/epimerase
MKFSISHIAWPYQEEDIFLKNIKEWGCDGVEIAPSRVWSEPVNSTQEERLEYKNHIAGFGLEIPAIQALLYTRRDLGLFLGNEIENQTVDYIKRLCHVAADLGAKVLVFGSPKNRNRNGISLNDALEIGASFFSKVALTAEKVGVCVCIEPLGATETDFINTCIEGLKLVEMVNNPGFGLHLDSKALSEEGNGFMDNLKKVIKKAKHFHISEPSLSEINSSGSVPHKMFADILQEYNYNRFVSIEMRTWPDHFNVVKRSIMFSKNTYFNF